MNQTFDNLKPSDYIALMLRDIDKPIEISALPTLKKRRTRKGKGKGYYRFKRDVSFSMKEKSEAKR